MAVVVTIDDQKYQTTDIDFETHCDGENITYVSVERIKVENHCDKCGRFNLVRVVLHSLEEVIKSGWLVPIESGD